MWSARKERTGLNFLAIKGNIRRRGPNTFQVRIYLGIDSDGKRRSHCKTIHGTELSAKKYAKEYIKKLNAEDPYLGSNLLLSDFVDSQNERDRARLAAQTLVHKHGILERIKLFFKGIALKGITPLMVEKFAFALESRGLAPLTIRGYFSILSSLFSKAKKLKLIKDNPCEGIELPKQSRKNKTIPLSSEEGSRFLKACDNVKGGEVLKMALLTGMRPGELLGLTWADIDFNKGTVQITKAAKHTKEKGAFLDEPKTTSARRWIYIDIPLIEMLKRMKKSSFSIFVFPNRKGQLNYPSKLKYLFKKVLKIAKIDRYFRLYDLRHSHASLLLEKGIPIQAISARLGHASINTTLSYYVHARPEQGRAAANILTDLFADTYTWRPNIENGSIPTKSDFLPMNDTAEKTNKSRPIFSEGSAFIPILSGNDWQNSEQSKLKIPI